MDIPSGTVEDFVRGSIEIGDVYKIDMDESDGITPKDGYSTRLKYFVVLGYDDEGHIYGGVVINSKINANLPSYIRDYYMEIPCSKYKFLIYDSFVNCSKIMTTNSKKLLKGDKLGEILQEDLDLIIGTVCGSPKESKKRLQQFGLI